jgi:drug/metabolite transporter (DMT)-like permease
MTSTERRGRGNLLIHAKLLFVAAAWGGAWTASREVALALPEAFAAWLRYAIVIPLLFAWLIWKEGGAAPKDSQGGSETPVETTGKGERYLGVGRKRLQIPDRGTLRDLALMGLFATTLYQLLYMHGMERTAAGDASVIITFNPAFTALLAIPFLGRRMTRKLAVGLLLGLAGVAIVTGWSPNNDIPFNDRLTGDILIMCAAGVWAASTNLMKRILEREDAPGRYHPTPLAIMAWAALLGWLMLTPFALWDLYTHANAAFPDTAGWLWIAYLAVISTVLAYVWFAQGVDEIGATGAATYVYLVPVFGILSGWLILDESLGFSLLVGLGLVLAGVRLAQQESIEEGARPKATAEDVQSEVTAEAIEGRHST